MRKTLIGIITYLTFLIIYFLHANFFNWFTIAGISPNLFVILVIFLGLFSSNYFTLVMSVIMGITVDFEVGKQAIGTTAIMFVIIGVLANYLDKNFSKDSKITILIMVTIGTLIYEIGLYILNMFIFRFESEIGIFVKIISIEIIYNAIITIILYNLIRKVGSIVEREFKERNILTRYF